MKFDFTPWALNALLKALHDAGYTFQTYADYVKVPGERVVILRHDVDARNKHALFFAEIQNGMGVKGTYYFRVVKGSWDEEIIRKIYQLGHEVGLHYEDMDRVRRKHRSDLKAMTEAAWNHFNYHLKRLRDLVPVETICNHGSPLSPYDNKMLWNYYDYRSLGIIADTYLDTDFNKMAYLTDTGRRWNGMRYSIRDRASEMSFSFPDIRTTWNLVEAIQQGRMPEKMMITLHPQRWTSNPWKWLLELIWQRMKNIVKYLIIKTGRR